MNTTGVRTGYRVFSLASEKWPELIKEWEEVGVVYQIPRRSKDRLEHFCKQCVAYLCGKRVLEIGANAGIFGYGIDKVSESYAAVEPGNRIIKKGKKPKTDYAKQLAITVGKMKNGKMFNETISEYCKHPEDTNAFVACFALYHFTDKEIALLKEHVWPKCDTVIIQNRCQDRPTKHNSYKLYKDKNVVKLFKEQGFGDIKVIPATGQDGKQQFSEIICLR